LRPEERCHYPVDPGHCKAHMTRFYYNHKYKKCKKFIYGGCKGNGNNFESFEECLHFCKGKWGRGFREGLASSLGQKREQPQAPQLEKF
uniref:BPTI/Kunitz inhibitor domain-containing protein n=1 Tax=Pseudonaja textilis TaxID=8673 RepID=A0A670ZLW0_PSETE